MSYVLRAVAAAAVFAALAGCSGDPEVREPKPTPSSTVADAQVTPPPRPGAMDDPDESGAATFALYWVNVADYAALSGDTAELRKISEQTCKGCASNIDLYERVHERGGEFTGGQQTFDTVAVERADDGDVVVRTTTMLAAGTYRESADAEVEKTSAESNLVSYRVTRVGDAWRMKELATDED